jgi:hypothetical protein
MSRLKNFRAANSESAEGKKDCKGNVTSLFVCHECQMFFLHIDIIFESFPCRMKKKEGKSNKNIAFWIGKKTNCISISMIHSERKTSARFLFTKSGCNKDFPRFFFFFRSSCVDSHIILPDCTYLCIYNLRAEITIKFENNFAHFSHSPYPPPSTVFSSVNIREIVLDNRSSVHEFLMHFSRLFCSFLTHSHVLRWKCIGNFHSLNIFFTTPSNEFQIWTSERL